MTLTLHRRHTGPPDPRSAARRGFTLIEVMMATVLVGIALVSSSWALSMAARTQQILNEDPLTAALLAKEIYELAESLPREPSGAVGVTNGMAVAALDSLEGALFAPPIKADGTNFTEYNGWAQQVDLDLYALNDLSTPTGEDPTLGVPPGKNRLYRLTVVILLDGAIEKTFQWWLTP